MKIIVDRDSVSAGDDMYGNEETFDVCESMTVADFFNFVNSNGYLAHIIGNDVAWILQNQTGKIGAYYTKTGEITHPEVKLKDKIDEANGDIQFDVRYYSNPELARKQN